MAKMNAMNNAWAWEIAKTNYHASRNEAVGFDVSEVAVWALAGKIYWVLTGKAWKEAEAQKVQAEAGSAIIDEEPF